METEKHVFTGIEGNETEIKRKHDRKSEMNKSDEKTPPFSCELALIKTAARLLIVASITSSLWSQVQTS